MKKFVLAAFAALAVAFGVLASRAGAMSALRYVPGCPRLGPGRIAAVVTLITAHAAL